MSSGAMDVDVDFDLTGKTADQIGQELEHNLWLKGFCVLDMKLEANLDDALDEVKDLRRAECFEPTPPEVVDGLLGPEGSGEIAWLTPARMGQENTETQKLQSINQDLFYIADCTRDFFQGIGLEGLSISDTLIVQGGETMPDGASDLTEASCSKWISTFYSAKLMMIYFLGPGDGLLEMQLLDEDAEPMIIKTRPDMLVILRSDIVMRKHASAISDYALCAWVMTTSLTGSRGWNAMSTDTTDKIPGTKELNEWAEQRLETLANGDPSELESIPRAWQRMLRTKYLRNSNLPVAIRGMGTHSPGTHDCEVLWKSLNNGVDYVSNVPLLRWDHAEYFDPNPQSYMESHVFTGGVCKTSINHGQFIDGIEMFDNKFFQISVSESGGMEPQQRHILETSYEGLYQAGYTKKSLMLAYIAVFTGCTNPEAMYINYTQGAGAGNVSQAITSNRTSFVLGIMGPSSSIDCEMASSHMALMVGASAVAPNHDWRSSSGGHSDASITGGVFLTCTPYMWPRFNAYMNPVGRACTFDQSADGYVRGESCTSLCQKSYMEKVDNEWVVPDVPSLGSMVGWRMTHSGRTASITAPSAPAQQDTVYHAMSDAGINTLDLDGIECHGSGMLLDDSVEVSAMAKLLRYDNEGDDEPAVLGAVKSNLGAQCEAAGMTSFVKVMMNIAFAVNAPNLHLKAVNPHIEMARDSLFMSTEHLAYREQYVFHGCSSRGFNGTNCHIIQWYMADSAKVRTERLLATSDPIAFWPAGGGTQALDSRASEGYFIVGSWGQWENPEPMQQVAEGTYKYTVTLGANSFESFQIQVDGDAERVLHPRLPAAASGCAVTGPSGFHESAGLVWRIDGRAQAAPLALPGTEAEGQLARRDVLATRDFGGPGDTYEVRLSMAGKFSAISWSKVAEADASGVADPALLGSYYVSGTWNGWGLEEMVPSPDASGVYTLLVGPLPKYMTKCEFQVVCNKDWDQTFHPPFSTISSPEWDENEVEGPNPGNSDKNWCIKFEGGDVFKIEFHRSLTSGSDKKRVAWRKV